MIVVDASTLVDVLVRAPAAEVAERRLFEFGQTLHAPFLIDIEIAQVVRRLVGKGEIGIEVGRSALSTLLGMSISRYPHLPLLSRIWALRHNITAYDAAYVALAEALGAPLLTRDRRLASSTGHRATIEAI